jgi:hypothetical protein
MNVPYVPTNAKVTDFVTFCTFVITQSCYPILLFPLLSHPKLIPFWSIPDRRTKFFTPYSITYFFFHLAWAFLLFAKGLLAAVRIAKNNDFYTNYPTPLLHATLTIGAAGASPQRQGSQCTITSGQK